MRFSQRCRFGLPAGLASHSAGNIGCPSRPYWVGVFRACSARLRVAASSAAPCGLL